MLVILASKYTYSIHIFYVIKPANASDSSSLAPPAIPRYAHLAMLQLRTITASVCAHKTVLMRVDFNVPLTHSDTGTQVADDKRLRRVLPTIQFLIKHGAKVILMSHLGRPKSPQDTQYSLAPIAQYLTHTLHTPVQFAPAVVGPVVTAAVHSLQPGEVLLLENLRFHPEEKANDPVFSQALAAHADIYINEAFSACHRAHASVVGVTQHLPAYAGLALTEEVTTLTKIMDAPKRPFVVVLGGAKISDKVAALKNLSNLADVVLIGGAAANNFLKAAGFEIYRSRTEEKTTAHPEDKDYTKVAQAILREHKTERILKDGYIPLPKILYPIDVVAAPTLDTHNKNDIHIIDLTHDMREQDEHVPLSYFDIGPKTRQLYAALLAEAGTIFWNGPMGVWENELFCAGTKTVAQALAHSEATTVIGGGDTISAAHHLHTEHKYTYVSAAGGAALELLGGKKLPGLAPITQ